VDFSHKHNNNKNKYSTVQLWVITLTTCIGGILSGYHLAIISPALPSIADSLSLSPGEAENVVGILYIGGVIGSLVAGPQCDHWGRKPTICVTSLLFAVGALIVVCASGYAGVMWGRFLLGMAIATSGVANVSYLTEMAPFSYRGSVVSVNEWFVCIGMFTSYWMGYNITYQEQLTAPLDQTNESKEKVQYQFMFGVTIFWALLQFTTMMLYVPESSAWLAQQRQLQYQRAIAVPIAGDPNISNSNSNSNNPKRFYHYKTWIYWWTDGLSFKSYYKHAFYILSFLAIAEQFCGHHVVLNFAPELFAEQMNLDKQNVKALIPSVYLGIIKLFVTAQVIWEVDKVGRRNLLLLGVSLITFSYIFLIAAFASHGAPSILQIVATPTENTELELKLELDDDNVNANVNFDSNTTHYHHPVLLAFGTCGLVVGYAISYGPITSLLTSELFSTQVRGRALAFSHLLQFLAGSLVSYTFLSGQESFGAVAPFITYFLNSLLSLMFIYLAIPETKGCDLENDITYTITTTHTDSIQTRLEQMWFWSYTSSSSSSSRSIKRGHDHISNLTSALASYDDLDHGHGHDHHDNDDNDDKQMLDRDRVVYRDHSNLLFESSNNADINVIPTEKLSAQNSFTIGADDDDIDDDDEDKNNVDADDMNWNHINIPTKPSATSLVAEDLDSTIMDDFDPSFNVKAHSRQALTREMSVNHAEVRMDLLDDDLEDDTEQVMESDPIIAAWDSQP